MSTANPVLMQQNLVEIYSAMERQFPWIHQPIVEMPKTSSTAEVDRKIVPERIRLVASLFGRLYDPSCGWGRFWDLFYRFLAFFKKTELRQRKLQEAFRVFRSNYSACYAAMQSHFNTAFNDLQEAFKSNSVIPNKVAIEGIAKWYQATYSFMKTLKKNPLRVTALFQSLLPEAFTFENQDITVIKNFFSLHTLMQLSNANVPFFDIAQLWKREGDRKRGVAESARTESERRVQEWSNRLFHASPSLSVSEWQRAFKDGIFAIVNMENLCRAEGEAKGKVETNRSDSVELRARAVFAKFVEMGCSRQDEECKQRKCNKALVPDPEHLAWRTQLHSGSELLFRGEKLTLGQPLNSKPSDENVVYTLVDKPDVVIRIADNKLKLTAMQHEMERKNPAIYLPYAKCIAVDGKGRFALFERVQTLNQLEWEPFEKETEISPAERVKYAQIIDLVERMLRNREKCFSPFKPTHFGFSKTSSYPVSTAPLKIGPFNFDEMEAALVTISKNNPKIFRLFMQKSGMLSSTEAAFYETVVREGLEGIDTNIPQLTILREITHYTGQVIDNGKALRREILTIRDRCFDALQARNQGAVTKVLPEKLKSAINESLLGCYREGSRRSKINAEELFKAATDWVTTAFKLPAI